VRRCKGGFELVSDGACHAALGKRIGHEFTKARSWT
jgi:hypothetical protein